MGRHGDDSATDLPLDVRARIQGLLDLVAKGAPYYDYFDLPRDADRKSIRRAYYGLAALVHPDRHAGHALGPWKAKMEQLFQALTSAHDILSDPAQREHYDQSLPPVSRTRVPTPAQQPRQSTPKQEAQRVAPIRPRSTPPARPASTPAQARSASPTPTPASAQRPLSPPTPARPTPAQRSLKVPTTPTPMSTRANEAQRREALARRLLAGRPSTTMRSASASGVDLSAAAAEALQTEAEGHERREDFTHAWRAWRRLSALRPDDLEPVRRALQALLRDGAEPDLHLASELGKRLVSAEPRNPRGHVMLAQVYTKARLPAAARSVLEHALSLGLNDPEIYSQLTRVSTPPPDSRR